MRIRTAMEIGLIIRDRRRKLKMTQGDLARRVGVARQWIIGIEKGKSRAEIGLVLRTLFELELHLAIETGSRPAGSGDKIPFIDINAIVDAARRSRNGSK